MIVLLYVQVLNQFQQKMQLTQFCPEEPVSPVCVSGCVTGQQVAWGSRRMKHAPRDCPRQTAGGGMAQHQAFLVWVGQRTGIGCNWYYQHYPVRDRDPLRGNEQLICDVLQ